ncbi:MULTISPECIES: hypothetical protein [Methylopilaceae]|uniref:Uncharacterized protein n=2 Tax=Methylopilaceae TaxID=3149309 RepID=A0A4Q0MA00_9HYPH|nr:MULTISPECIES: hypothetical protein [Methylocystaceae]QZO00545.1 hypothetical protein K6K41_02100 [Chenggangzhangella methanolivorans]RXF69984.1 hypothetical protein EK403_17825 [Hansschlegelia zhihuaiae]
MHTKLTRNQIELAKLVISSDGFVQSLFSDIGLADAFRLNGHADIANEMDRLSGRILELQSAARTLDELGMTDAARQVRQHCSDNAEYDYNTCWDDAEFIARGLANQLAKDLKWAYLVEECIWGHEPYTTADDLVAA